MLPKIVVTGLLLGRASVALTWFTRHCGVQYVLRYRIDTADSVMYALIIDKGM